MTTSQIVHFAVAMLTIANPVGSLAIYAGLTADRTAADRNHMALVAGIAIAVIFLVVAWSGDFLMTGLGLTFPAFETAGGLIVLLLALSMLHSKTSAMQHTPAEHEEAQSKESIAVVPIAMPMIAGPGAITTIIIQTQRHSDLDDRLLISGICLGVAVIMWAGLAIATKANKVLGVAGVNIATRIGGLILATIALEMLGVGLKGLLPGLA